MKTSTLMTMVLLSASCFAAPAHTARDSTEATLADRADGLSTNPASAGSTAAGSAPQQWETIALPKSRHLSHAFDAPDEHLQT
ncbi:hypothetical protein [Paraburkholderia megapolitana]|uniref:Uncharacterized protein n=1 Tax=Paraburkholderia megapolitana TaxID=420953 RepID=A0A1I3N173_9BURK|nr:hypothetical protein [Paraburkholderia megapolitana]QDQ84203.1 hypothetical protein FNZ07_24125 [Paraburkholderia megapolitana]SFJ02755.1 hypothetical protein SAMN05192543_105188 [Paraburkholderia megapolitana]